MSDTTRYMKFKLPKDCKNIERVVIYGTNNTEIEVNSDMLVTANEIPREGEGYTVEEYRKVLISVHDMNGDERKKAFGEEKWLYEYISDFPASKIVEEYRAYKNGPKIGEYWKRKIGGDMVVVQCVEKGNVYVYRCDNGYKNTFSYKYFMDNYTRTEHKSKYFEAFLSEMKEVSE